MRKKNSLEQQQLLNRYIYLKNTERVGILLNTDLTQIRGFEILCQITVSIIKGLSSKFSLISLCSLEIFEFQSVVNGMHW